MRNSRSFFIAIGALLFIGFVVGVLMINAAFPVDDDPLIFEFGGDSEVFINENGEVVDEFEPYTWPDRQERLDFANDTAVDIVESRGYDVFDDGTYIRLGTGETIHTSPNGIEWSDIATSGFEGHDDVRGLAANNGRYATIVWDFGNEQQPAQIFVATSDNLTDWALHELPILEELRWSTYPVDVAISDDRVSVLVGVDQPEFAGFVFSGPIGTEPSGVALPGKGAPASLVAAQDMFFAAVQVPGDDIPNTLIWKWLSDGEWETTDPLPDGLTGKLHAVGDSLVVTGLPYSDVEVFVAVSDDAGRSWSRKDIDPEFGDVLAGPAGIVAMQGNGLLYSEDGRGWDFIEDDRLDGDQGADVFREATAVIVGEDDLIMSLFESDGSNDFSSSYFSIELPQ